MRKLFMILHLAPTLCFGSVLEIENTELVFYIETKLYYDEFGDVYLELGGHFYDIGDMVHMDFCPCHSEIYD